VREYRQRARALPDAEFVALRDALLGSPLVGASTLGGPFQSSRGFDVIFKAAGRARVEERFPQLAPWLSRTLGEPAVRALTPWWTRTLSAIPNAWYLNVLLVSEGGTVARHVDVTLRKHSEVDDALPCMVSVLYLQVPHASGGELQLWDGADPIARLKPAANTSVHFRGDLAHAVNAFSGAPGQLRASLVIEQYHFPDEVLTRLPDFRLDSRAGFAAYLEHHAGQAARPTFRLED
jgi:hypothetical protein